MATGSGLYSFKFSSGHAKMTFEHGIRASGANVVRYRKLQLA